LLLPFASGSGTIVVVVEALGGTAGSLRYQGLYPYTKASGRLDARLG
jgi:hypothetical protein